MSACFFSLTTFSGISCGHTLNHAGRIASAFLLVLSPSVAHFVPLFGRWKNHLFSIVSGSDFFRSAVVGSVAAWWYLAVVCFWVTVGTVFVVVVVTVVFSAALWVAAFFCVVARVLMFDSSFTFTYVMIDSFTDPFSMVGRSVFTFFRIFLLKFAFWKLFLSIMVSIWRVMSGVAAFAHCANFGSAVPAMRNAAQRLRVQTIRFFILIWKKNKYTRYVRCNALRSAFSWLQYLIAVCVV